jgi:serine/threonine protein kinase
MKTVHKKTEHELSPFGVKSPDTQTMKMPETSDLARKFRALAELKHHVPEVVEYFETSSSVYLVTELCEGELLSLLRANGGTLKESDIRIVLRGILLALSYLHSLGTAHRYVI